MGVVRVRWGRGAVAVTDDDIVSAMAALGRTGILSEPAGAAALAGLGHYCQRREASLDLSVGQRGEAKPVNGLHVGHRPPQGHEVVVLVVTGNGARWPAALADVTAAKTVVDVVEAIIPGGSQE